MSTNLSQGPIQVFDASVASLNLAFVELQERLDQLKGLRGRAEIWNRLRVNDPLETQDAVTLGSMNDAMNAIDGPSNPLVWLGHTVPALTALSQDDLLTVLLPWIPLLGGLAMDTLTGHAQQRRRLVTLADATSITPPMGLSEATWCTQTNTQAAGTLGLNAPTGNLADMDQLQLRVTSTNSHTWSFNAIYRGGTDLALPTTVSGGGATDYLGFQYHGTDMKLDLVALSRGY